MDSAMDIQLNSTMDITWFEMVNVVKYGSMWSISMSFKHTISFKTAPKVIHSLRSFKSRPVKPETLPNFFEVELQ